MYSGSVNYFIHRGVIHNSIFKFNPCSYFIPPLTLNTPSGHQQIGPTPYTVHCAHIAYKLQLASRDTTRHRQNQFLPVRQIRQTGTSDAVSSLPLIQCCRGEACNSSNGGC